MAVGENTPILSLWDAEASAPGRTSMGWETRAHREACPCDSVSEKAQVDNTRTYQVLKMQVVPAGMKYPL